MKNVIFCHGGAPTAVINASLYGAIKELKDNKFEGKIFAARFGSDGLYHEDFIDLTDVNEKDLELLKTTPGTAIGSSRFPLYQKEYSHIIDVLVKHDIGYVVFTGGNGSMDTLGNIYLMAKEKGIDIKCIGIPKTIDNDLGSLDHAPGFASNANYLIETIRDCKEDVKGLPIHVSVIEAMGRNAGWLTASSVLARDNKDDAPQMILLPEVPFDEDDFIKTVKEKWDKKHGLIIVCSEGLKDKNGNPIVEPIFKTDRATYFGDVSTHLATLIIKKLGIKARSEKPGLIQRCSRSLVSKIDQEEAIMVGKKASEELLKGNTGYMIGIKRISENPYKSDTFLIPLKEVMMKENCLPEKFIKGKYDVSDEFIDWLKPLVNKKKETISFVDKK